MTLIALYDVGAHVAMLAHGAVHGWVVSEILRLSEQMRETMTSWQNFGAVSNARNPTSNRPLHPWKLRLRDSANCLREHGLCAVCVTTVLAPSGFHAS